LASMKRNRPEMPLLGHHPAVEVNSPCMEELEV
jgi:hypothetical protein